jgi:hypothetical protein
MIFTRRRSKKMNELSALYDRNYTEWAKRNAELLQARRFSEVDIEHLIDELGDMSKSDQRELENRLRVLLSHLLKWQYQSRKLEERWKEFDGKSWRNTIIHQRTQIHANFDLHPSVRRLLGETITAAYPVAARLAAKETGLPASTFPKTCPYSEQQILDDDFYPAQE